MKRILFLTHCYPSSKNDIRGIFFRYWIEGLRKLDIDIDVITPSWNQNNSYNKLGDYGENIWRFKYNKKLGGMKLFNFIDIFNFCKLIFIWRKTIGEVHYKKKDWDLVISAWGIPAGLLLNHKSLRTTHKVIWWLGSDFYKFKNGALSYIIKYVLNQANSNWTNSNQMQRGLQKLTNLPIKFVPNQSIQFLDVKERKLSKCPNIISIGRLEKVKNFELAIKAIKQVIKEGFNLNYEIIGSGPQEEFLRSLTFKDNNINLLGFRNKEYINKKLNNTDIVLITSNSEGNPNIFFEALAAGAVIVSTNVGDIKAETQCTKLALVSPPRDLNKLVENIKKALNGSLIFNNEDTRKIFNKYSSNVSIDLVKELLSI
tara:strand:- start:84 stop:1196 length:1113 start_codon:yes stop_codon:yes gene_type:complete